MYSTLTFKGSRGLSEANCQFVNFKAGLTALVNETSASLDKPGLYGNYFIRPALRSLVDLGAHLDSLHDKNLSAQRLTLKLNTNLRDTLDTLEASISWFLLEAKLAVNTLPSFVKDLFGIVVEPDDRAWVTSKVVPILQALHPEIKAVLGIDSRGTAGAQEFFPQYFTRRQDLDNRLPLNKATLARLGAKIHPAKPDNSTTKPTWDLRFEADPNEIAPGFASNTQDSGWLEVNHQQNHDKLRDQNFAKDIDTLPKLPITDTQALPFRISSLALFSFSLFCHLSWIL